MMSEVEISDTLRRAYVPEHSVGLMASVSGGEPYLTEELLVFRRRDLIIVIGYPLDRRFEVQDFELKLDRIKKKFNPARMSLIASQIPPFIDKSRGERESDYYYVLDLENLDLKSGSIRAAGRAIRTGRIERRRHLDDSHRELAEDFTARVVLPPRVRALLSAMWTYTDQAQEAWVLNARDGQGRLAAFYVLDLAPGDFVTYVIGGHSKTNYLPGAADALMMELINLSREHKKKYVHLGLGVNEGIRRFKEKWGGRAWLKYESAEFRIRRPRLWEAIFERWGRS
ncbi:MAG: hypothetical protein AB1641_09630 [Thermodesulfobacteriota bacterium]